MKNLLILQFLKNPPHKSDINMTDFNNKNIKRKGEISLISVFSIKHKYHINVTDFFILQ